MKQAGAGVLTTFLSDLAGLGVMAGVALLLGLAVNCFRNEPLPLFNNPVTTQPAAEISLAELEDLSARHAAQIIYARAAPFFAAGHIPGALNVPYEELKRAPHVQPTSLPASKLTPLVVYCSDVSCPAAKSTARILQSLGYRNVAIFPGGWYVWERDAHSIETSSP